MIRMLPDELNKTREKIASFGSKGEFLLWCIDQGWHLIRLRRVLWIDGKPRCTCKDGERCPGPGKHPRDLVSEPLDPADPQTLCIIAQRLQQDPGAGYGVHLGLSGLVALDVDTKSDGLANWARLRCELNMCQAEPFTVSGSGGPHYLFKAPASCDARRGWTGPNSETLCSVKIAGVGDFKAGQGFVVIPFSAHRSGGTYTRADGPVYEEMTAELVDLVNRDKKFRLRPAGPASSSRSASSGLAAGGSSPLERAIAYLEHVSVAVSGQHGHDATYKAARLMVKDFALSIDDAFAAIAGWNSRCVPPWSDEDLMRKLEEADRNPGELGRLLNTPWSPPLGAEGQWLRDLVCRIHWGRKILTTGPRDTITRSDYATGWDPRDIPLDDLAGDRGGEDLDQVAGPSSGDRLNGLLPAAESSPASTLGPAGETGEARRPPCQSCPHAIPVVMVNRESKKGAIFRFPCRRLSCPWCGPVKRDHWKATVKHHVAELIRRRQDLDTEPVYLFRCRRGAWLCVSAYIRAAGGDFFRLDYQATADGPGDAYMVLSTVRPHGAKVTSYTAEAARDRFCAAIDGLPCDVRGRLFASSRRWKLLDDGETGDKHWEKVCRIKTSQSTTERILTEHGREWRYLRGTARWWQWQAIVFSIAGVDFGDLVDELDRTGTLEGRRRWWGKSKAPPESDDWSTPETAPQPLPTTFVLDLQ